MRKLITRSSLLALSSGFLLLGAGCANLKAPRRAKEFVLERSWARNTVQKEYLGARINHVMEPVLFASLVIQGNEIDGLVAYNKTTGQKIWERSLSGGVTAGAKVDKGVLYFGAGDGFFYALDAETGQTKWSFPIKSKLGRWVPSNRNFKFH